MVANLPVPARRLRQKTSVGSVTVNPSSAATLPPLPLAAHWTVEEDLCPEDANRTKQVYLVTLPALARSDCVPSPANVCPAAWTHADIARVVVDVFQRPVHSVQHQARGTKRELEMCVVFRERHVPRPGEVVGPYHWHVALKASDCFRFAPYKRAFAQHHGLATHWSCSHEGYWSVVRYGCMPSPRKPQADLDPSPYPWSKTGPHPPLFDVCQEPLTAAAWARRREHKVKEAGEKGKPEPRPTELDLYPIIVRHGIKNTPDDPHACERLISWLKQHGTPSMLTFAFKNRQKLNGIIDDVWKWETVDDFLESQGQTRIEALLAAARGPCPCGAAWRARAEEALALNGIDTRAFCNQVLRLLQEGRGEHVSVMVLMGRRGGEGKSFLLAPLRNLYGVEHVQATPQKGNFPLLGLERKKVAVLEEWNMDPEVLALATQLLWYEGKPFPITRPQNSGCYNGHLLYQGSAPIFVTAKETDLGPLIAQAQQDAVHGTPSEHTMLLRRLQIWHFWHPLPVRPWTAPKIFECPTCFALMLMHHSR